MGRGAGGGLAAALALSLGLAVGAGAAWVVGADGEGARAPRGDPRLLEAVQAAARAARTDTGLLPEREAALRAYLNLMATELGLLSEPAQVVAAGAEGGVELLSLRWSLRGDPLDLPPLLSAFERQRHVILIERVEVRADPLQPRGAQLRLRARLHRPLLPDRDHMLGALRARAQVPPEEHRLLLAAAELYAWRRFAAADAEARREAQERGRALLRALPSALIAARERGEVLRWVAGTGLVRAAGSAPDKVVGADADLSDATVNRDPPPPSGR